MDDGLHGTHTEGLTERSLPLLEESASSPPGWLETNVLRRLMETPMFGIAVTDGSGRIVEANDAFLAMVGHPREALARGSIRWDMLTSPGSVEATQRALRELRELRQRGSVPPFEKQYVHRSGRHIPVLVGLSLLDEQHHLAVVLELTERKHAEATLRFLADASRALVYPHDTPRALLERVVALATGTVATFCAVDLVQADGELGRVAASHRDPALAAPSRQAPPLPPPQARALLMGLLRPGTAQRLSDLPDEARRLLRSRPGDRAVLGALDSRAVLVVPLRHRERMLGVMLVGHGEALEPFSAHDAALAEDLAQRIVAALDNLRLLEETRQAQRRARFLARASRVLGLVLEPIRALEAVTRLAVPSLADWCAVDLVDEDGTLHRVTALHRCPAKTRYVWELARRWPPAPEDPFGPGLVLLTGQPSLNEHITDVMLARRARGPEHLRALRDLAPTSCITIPLQAHGRTVGTLALVHAESQRHYQPSDLRLLMDLAGRIGLAVDNARLYRTAREAVHVRDEFLAVASHELKTPLTPLNLRLQALLRELDGPLDPERLLGHVKVLQRQTKQLGLLVESLLDVSYISTGTLRLDLEDVDLAQVVRTVAGRYAGMAQRMNSALCLEVESPLVGRWDEERLEQVVGNLVANALKYGAGRPVRVRTEARRGWARLLVSDEGIGIAPENVRRIFDRFERAVSSEHFGGLGLGLYISRHVVEALGGTIRVTSEPGQGATFEVSLPLPPEH
ncbi:ATP-binding protein [Myxococcaceae bacterium GXIMD 01537]